ncbi:MAG: hypothetical protein M1835_002014 [Candelina submexicana]|nr:MAG: hypothetical protein M1835_002014 [Candelina submexicana]
MTKLSWKALVPLALLAPQLVAGIPAFDEDTSVEVQNRGLEDRVPACANLGTCFEKRGDDPKDHIPDDKKDDADKDSGDDDGEEYESSKEKGEDPSKDSPEDYGDYYKVLTVHNKEKRDLIPRAPNYLRMIPAVGGKLPREAWQSNSKRKAFTIRRKNEEKDKNKPPNYKWKFVEREGFTFKNTEVDHVLEIQRLEFLYRSEKVPDNAGKQEAWDKMRKAISLDTDNKNKDKIAIAHTLNAPANLRGVHERVNALKGIVTKMSQKASNGPDYKGKWARSTIWALAKFFKATKKQYEETAAKVKDVVKDVSGDKDQAEYIEKQLKDLLAKDTKHVTDKATEKQGKDGEKVADEDMPEVPKI